MLNITIDGVSVPVMTVAEFAAEKNIKPTTMAQRVMAYKKKGGELEAAYKSGNMQFYRVTDLEIVNSASERPAKPKRPTVEQWIELNDRYDVAIKLLGKQEGRLKFLEALEAAGVDNWEGYGEAIRIHSGEEDE